MNLTVLKLGWEFPPYFHGGLGIACEGIVNGLVYHEVRVVVVLPHKVDRCLKRCKFIVPYQNRIKNGSISSDFSGRPAFQKNVQQNKNSYKYVDLYGDLLFQKVKKYTLACRFLSNTERFTIIHAHDWMTFKAGLVLKKLTNKPLVVHVHSTEYCRTNSYNINKSVCDIEYRGLLAADKIITVSQQIKRRIVRYYKISPEKIIVAYNAVTLDKEGFLQQTPLFPKKNKLSYYESNFRYLLYSYERKFIFRYYFQIG